MLEAASRTELRAAPRIEALDLVRRLDWLLLAAVAGLVAYGLWVIAGVTRYDVEGDELHYVVRQAIAAGVGLVALLAAVAVDPDRYRRAKTLVYATTTALMVLVFALGEAARGSTRWIDLGFFQFQPSEFGKVFFVLALAGFLADAGRRVTSAGVVARVVLIGLAPTLLVFAQPDLGTALVYAAALGACLLVAGTRWTHLVLLLALAVFVVVAVVKLLPAAGVEVLKPYQADRLTAFLHPERDIQGLGYNVNQSTTAIGSGRLTGRGVDSATQTRLDYLPEHATDFVFSALAEQRGFMGASVLLLLYLLVVWRGLRIVTVARDAFSAIAAAGIVVAFLFQAGVNVGMTMGIAPVTGIPLPFVTVGGSSMAANLLAIGVLQAIHARGRLPARRRSR